MFHIPRKSVDIRQKSSCSSDTTLNPVAFHLNRSVCIICLAPKSSSHPHTLFLNTFPSCVNIYSTLFSLRPLPISIPPLLLRLKPRYVWIKADRPVRRCRAEKISSKRARCEWAFPQIILHKHSSRESVFAQAVLTALPPCGHLRVIHNRWLSLWEFCAH